jgi:quercetin dioxygenase-like cupin family protein
MTRLNLPRYFLSTILSLSATLFSLSSLAHENEPVVEGRPRPVYLVKAVAEKVVKQLPDGPLYWRIENFPSMEKAEAAMALGKWNPNTVSFDAGTSLVAEVAGRIWFFTLGHKGGSTIGGTFVAEIGPLPPISAPEYRLRINHGSGPAGAVTPTHSHPGSEAFYVVSGKLGQKTAKGVNIVEAGHTMNGQNADTAMEVFNDGDNDLTALIMFVVDATRPFSTPAKFQ